MATTDNSESEIKSWLQAVWSKEGVKDVSVNVLGNSEKGDGYMGDIVFVEASGITEDGSTKEYNFVLKCSKRSQALREQIAIKDVFANEINVYDKVFPAFTQFQRDKGIEEIFDSVPKYHGSFTSENMEVIILENLKKSGYELWDKKRPLTRKHINMVVEEYGKFHAISAAMADQQPDRFQTLVKCLKDIVEGMKGTNFMEAIFGPSIEEVYDLVKDDFPEEDMVKWKNLGRQLEYILYEIHHEDSLKVIGHGDCWNNNFMYYSKNNDNHLPLKVAFLDWQLARFASPIFDLSYFLFACISGEDLEQLDDILKFYYKSFSNHLKKLGSDPEKLFSFNKFLEDWKTFSKYGIVMSSMVPKISLTEKDEVVDIGEMAETGNNFTNAFNYEVKDKVRSKKRIAPIVKYAVQQNLI